MAKLEDPRKCTKKQVMTKYKPIILATCLTVALSLLLVACAPTSTATPTPNSAQNNGEVVYTQERAFALDTLVDIKVYHYADRPVDEAILSSTMSLIDDLENTLSSHIVGSDIDKVNNSAGKRIAVSAITYQTVQNSLIYSTYTSGLFDVTAGPLIDLWAIDPPDGHVPTKDELANALPKVDYSAIEFLDGNQLMIRNDMKINLGAIAKGTIADQVKTHLLAKGVTSALINLGGNVLTLGSKPDGSNFIIGIQDPADNRGAYLMTLGVADKALVSSGDYERFFEVAGIKYHHILNPKTGYPANTNIAQVTIVAPSSEIADGLSTSVLLLGLKDGIALVERLDDVDAIFITKDNKVYFTGDIEKAIVLSETQMQGYTITDDLNDLN